ncbi:hypothetical protein L3Y34_009349 [Caenorhabditis briggsae]|uniref:Protein kinase domain-containing protein n=1 Tax=Caenorhabditis briggsae TaxID=6238 RepID=A0AAE9D1G6_CAEBR|nr:hypothetical protein L3Y34_009349 [Caenorhabditis briggsae]
MVLSFLLILILIFSVSQGSPLPETQSSGLRKTVNTGVKFLGNLRELIDKKYFLVLFIFGVLVLVSVLAFLAWTRSLVGAVTYENLDGAMIITEYAENGSLFDYLRKIKSQSTFSDLLVYEGTLPQKTETFSKRPGVSNDLSCISTVDLVSFAYQIKNGMVYLASIPCVHRYLAIRNIFLVDDGTKKKELEVLD